MLQEQPSRLALHPRAQSRTRLISRCFSVDREACLPCDIIVPDSAPQDTSGSPDRDRAKSFVAISINGKTEKYTSQNRHFLKIFPILSFILLQHITSFIEPHVKGGQPSRRPASSCTNPNGVTTAPETNEIIKVGWRQINRKISYEACSVSSTYLQTQHIDTST